MGTTLTDARKRALRVLLDHEASGHLVRISNQTSVPGQCVYWQSADWLIREGLATMPGGGWGDTLTLTDAGREAAKAVTS